MADFLEAITCDAKELILGGFFIFVVLIIIGALATMPGATPEAKAVVEQTQDAISYAWIFYLGLPSLGGIIAIILLINKFMGVSPRY